MAEIEVQIHGLKELRQAFRDYPKISEPVLQKAIVASQFVFQKHNLKDDPTPWRTGNLLQSFRFNFGRLTARYFPTARYSIYVHQGTRPHVIRPRNRLALYWEGAQHPVRMVRHPGTQPNRFMPAIVQRSVGDLNKLFREALDLVNKEIAKRTNIVWH